ncbi:MAG: DNA helicase rad5 [Stictis urceolatum]|nr:DNA helicase rad5 [Stictis urceolata]
MSSADIQAPPPKRRRFFLDLEEDESASEKSHSPRKRPSTPRNNDNAQTFDDAKPMQAFDRALIEAMLGELPEDTLEVLQNVAGNDTERAINMYLDGSWQTDVPSRTAINDRQHTQAQLPSSSASRLDSSPPPAPTSSEYVLERMPEKRYIGAFGVAAWATRSGSNLLKHGECVNIERTKSKQVKLGRGGKPIPLSRQKNDVIVRFTNSRGSEVGRLPEDVAVWVSSLIDQKVCRFEGTCVYAPDMLRVNDTLYIQLRSFLLRRTFDSSGFIKPQDNNRATGVFEEKETTEEQSLRLRQVALVKLFGEINLLPSSKSDMGEQHKRERILQAAEQAEQSTPPDKKPKADSGSSTSTADEEEEDGKELEQDQLDSLYKKAQSFDFNTPEREPADTFAMTLRKYQKQALHWMISKENDEKNDDHEASMHPLWEEYKWPTKDVDDKELPIVDRQDSFYVNPYSGELSLDFPTQEQNCLGGILADEMGLGKTIEMMSLIHSNPSEIEIGISGGPATVNNLPKLSKSGSIQRAPCTTLVVAPMSLLAQWDSEAGRASLPGTLKSLVYYGAEKAASLRNMCCEANAISAPNVVITSYGVVLSEFNQVAARGGDRGQHDGVFSLDFHRIILDEAHFVKNRQSKTAKACYELNARHRWVLTGTPIVNRLEDLFSLVRFLRVEPWSNFSFWKTFITVPFESKDFIRALDVVQTVLEPLVLRRTKDMKTPDGTALVPLPPRTIDIEEIELSKTEQEVYDWIFTRAKRTFNATMEAGTLLKSYTTIFAQLLRLRQSCCHPILTRNKAIAADEEDAAAASDIANGLADDMDLQELIDRFSSAEAEQDANRFGAHVLQQIQDEADNECPICSEEPMNDPAVTGCWHSACKECLLNYIEHQKDKHELPRCFNCREPINKRDVFEVIRHEDPVLDDDDLYSSIQTGSPAKRISLRRVGAEGSAKIAALISHLKALRREDDTTKSVVFSQFTSFLDIISPALTREGIPFLRFDGAMAQKQRAAVLTEFAETKKKGTVLLLSLRAGGVGLNLTMAKRVFMMDPWWSFAVEAQAIDRVHRMGQEEEVKVIRFIVKGSIEGRMLRVQDRKKFIASSLGMMSEEEKKMQRIEDIKELLS